MSFILRFCLFFRRKSHKKTGGCVLRLAVRFLRAVHARVIFLKCVKSLGKRKDRAVDALSSVFCLPCYSGALLAVILRRDAGDALEGLAEIPIIMEAAAFADVPDFIAGMRQQLLRRIDAAG